VAIRASSARQVDALIADLAGVSDVKRDAAVARLTVIGARAVERLIELGTSDAGPAARTAAFRALEAIADPRALDAAVRGSGDKDAAVASAAIGVVRAFVRSARSAIAVDRLTAVALDQRRPDAVRVAAVRALNELDRATVAPVMKALHADRSEAVKQAAAAGRSAAAPRRKDPSATLSEAVEGSLPDDPAALRQMISDAAEAAPLPALLAVLERVRDREAREPRSRRSPWTNARAAAHVALARRNSRLALYDLRESLERAAEPLPVDMLAALSLIGDASCLEPIAAAHSKSTDDWWRAHLEKAFTEIAARERLTPRHATLKRIKQRYGWPR
jgi:hypothetical protein